MLITEARRRDLHVLTSSRTCTKGVLAFGGRHFPCALGLTGITASKREGDGASPAGAYTMLAGFYRADRLSRPSSHLPLRPTKPNDGWCDDPQAPQYNQLVTLPFQYSHEELWREDELYDVVIMLDQNIHPRKPGGGSAIFFHIARSGFPPTAGCIAVTHDTMRHALQYARRGSQMIIGQGQRRGVTPLR